MPSICGTSNGESALKISLRNHHSCIELWISFSSLSGTCMLYVHEENHYAFYVAVCVV